MIIADKDTILKILDEFFRDSFKDDPVGVADWFAQNGQDIDEFLVALDIVADTLEPQVIDISELLEALKLFTCASMSESRPSRGETFIGWQKDDGLTAHERVDIARRTIMKAEGRL